jgi:chitodextrinase
MVSCFPFAFVAHADAVIPNITQVVDHGIPGMYLGTARAADVDNDGKVDVIMAGAFNHMDGKENGSGIIRIYHNDSTGPGDFSFSLMQEFSQASGHLTVNGARSDVVVGDYDNDGDTDFFAVFTSDQPTVVGTNNGNGNFSLSELPFTGRHITIADLNNDGYIELINTRGSAPLYYAWNPSNKIWEGKQNGFLNDLCLGAIVSGDLDGDGYADILAGGNCDGFGNQSNSSQVHSHWFGNDNGNINPDAMACLASFGNEGGQNNCSGGMDNGGYVIDDFDKDGNNDIAFAGSHVGLSGPPGTTWIQYDFAIFYNTDGTGQNFDLWESAEGGVANDEYPNISSGDLNNDGYPDLFFMGHRNIGGLVYVFESRLYINDGTGAMVRAHKSLLPNLGAGNGFFADFDNDGHTDLLYQGATEAFHYNYIQNGVSGYDPNTVDTIKTIIFKNTSNLPVDTTPPSAPTQLSASPASDTEMDLSWVASTDPESGISIYNVYRDGNKIASVTATTFNDTGLTENTQYTYTIEALNGAGLTSSLSSEVTATTLQDTNSPVVNSVSAVSATQITVVFSEPVDTTSAQQIANYLLSPSVSVVTASLSTDLSSVTLTTAELTSGTTYTLSISNVLDLASTPNAIAANTQVTFEYTGTPVLDGNLPNGYEWDVLMVGKTAYSDRSYTFSSVPLQYQQLAFMRTKNDDKLSSGNSFLTFAIDQDSTVYVAYDSRNTTPSWLSGWASTGESLGIDESSAQTTQLNLYKKDFPAGTVNIGGNEYGNSMYIIVVEPQSAGNGGDTGGGDTGGGDTGGGDTGGGDTGGGDTGGGDTDGGDGSITSDNPTPVGSGAMSYFELLVFLALVIGWIAHKTRFSKIRTKQALIALCLVVTPLSSFATNPNLINMPDNTWMKVPFTTDPAGSSMNAGILGYSGMAYDSVNHQLLIFGGGHNDYGGNEVWAFDIDSQVLKRMYNPDPESAHTLDNYDTNEPGKLQSSGRPLSRHTYDNIEFVDHAGVMVTFGGYTVDSATGGGEIGMLYPKDTWSYSYNQNSWTYMSNTPYPFVEAGGSAYDASSGLLVALFYDQTWVYDIDNDQWTRKYPANRPPDHIEINLEYDSKREIVYSFGGEFGDGPGNDLWFYDAKVNQWTKLSPSGALPPAAGGYGLAYDRVNDKLIAYRSGVGTWVYDPVLNQWTQQNPSTGNPVEFAGRIHGNFKYDRVNNVSLLVSYNANYQAEIWAYRYQSSPDQTPPTAPGSLQASNISANAVELSWGTASDSDTGIANYTVYRDNQNIATVSATSYTDSGLSESTTYQYEVSAINGGALEGPKSAALSVTTLADTVAPTIEMVTASGVATQVQVTFGEAVNIDSAVFQISPTISVDSVSLSDNHRVVTLGTGALSENVQYTLTVNGVFDEAASPNMISANSTATFIYVAELQITGTTPAGYQWDTLDVGKLVYVDRPGYTYQNVAADYIGLDYLRTANDDKSANGDAFLSFNVNQAVRVFVAYDERNTVLPGWLSTWTDTTDQIIVDESGTQRTMHVYSKDFAQGQVQLGGNTYGNSMYTVMISINGGNNGGGDTGGGDTGGGDTGGGDTGGGDSGGGDTGGGDTGGTDTGANDPPSDTAPSAGSLGFYGLIILLGFLCIPGIQKKRSARYS